MAGTQAARQAGPGAALERARRGRVWAAVARRRTLAAFTAFATLGALNRGVIWGSEVGFDGGQYLYIGQVLLDGGTPYVDAANNKGPALLLLFALIRLVAGTSTVAVWLIFLLFATLAALAAYAYVARYAGRGIGLLVGILLAVIATAPFPGNRELHSEQFGLAPMMAALWLASRGGRWSVAGAGASVALAVLMNPAFAIVVPFAAAELWHSTSGARIRSFGLAVAGGIALAIPVLGWIAVSGAFDEMMDQVVGQARGAFTLMQLDLQGVTAQVGPGPPAPGGAEPADPQAAKDGLLDFENKWLAAVALVGSVVALWDRRLRWLAAGTILWLVASWARIAASSYTYDQHFYLAVPALAAGIGLGVAALWRGRPAGWRLAIPVVAVLAILWSPVLKPGVWSLVTGVDGPLRGVSYPAAAFIGENTAPDETVYSIDPQVNWLSDRRSPSRFFDFYEIESAEKSAEEWQADLLRAPPSAIAVTSYPSTEVEEGIFKLVERHPYTPIRNDNVTVLVRSDRSIQSP